MKLVNQVPGLTLLTVLGGIKLPRSVPVFDCRTPEGQEFMRTPNGRSLLGSEKAAYALGLRSDDGTYTNYDTTPLSCQCYLDFRTCSESELTKTALDMRKALRDEWRDYRSALANPAGPDEGGSWEAKPVALCLSNYGWSVMCDRRHFAVRAFSK